MHYEAELGFLQDILQKCLIRVNILDRSQPLSQHLLKLNESIHLGNLVDAKRLADRLPEIKPGILYRLQDQLGGHFLYCLLPGTPEERVLLVGPYFLENPDTKRVMELAEKHKLSPNYLTILENHCSNIPVLPASSRLFAVIDTFGERLWGQKGFTIQDVTPDPYDRFEPAANASAEDTLFYMRTLEQRYAYENSMMDAVSKGQDHKINILLDSFPFKALEQRTADPLRNTKNYCIIMNTLLRKAAERGGVHPLNLDRTSSNFAIRVEQATSLNALPQIVTEMLHAYCRLVRKNTLRSYSPPVQRALTLIEADLAGSLSLRTLACNLNISSSYLSSLFKKETGHTITDYIVMRRMDMAQQLLTNTKLQVQTIAQYCGIADVHYFSKLFKRATGLTPSEFRQSACE